MNFKETKLKGAFIVEVEKINDDRGFFGRVWCQKEMESRGLNGVIRQCNTSLSLEKGTVRGMHYQISPYQESKFLSCTHGRVFDVIIDLRLDSPTFMQWFGTILDEYDNKMMYVPENFAHGVLSLKDNSQITYMVSEFYTPGSERGIRYNDPAFNIEWPVEIGVVSEKDICHPDFDLENYVH